MTDNHVIYPCSSAQTLRSRSTTLLHHRRCGRRSCTPNAGRIAGKGIASLASAALAMHYYRYYILHYDWLNISFTIYSDDEYRR